MISPDQLTIEDDTGTTLKSLTIVVPSTLAKKNNFPIGNCRLLWYYFEACSLIDAHNQDYGRGDGIPAPCYSRQAFLDFQLPTGTGSWSAQLPGRGLYPGRRNFRLFSGRIKNLQQE